MSGGTFHQHLGLQREATFAGAADSNPKECDTVPCLQLGEDVAFVAVILHGAERFEDLEHRCMHTVY